MKENSKAFSTIIHITTANSLLQQEVIGRKKALYEEQRKRKKEKTLMEVIRAKDQQVSTFWSPQKIQRAKDAQTRLDEEKEAKKQAKEAAKIQKAIDTQFTQEMKQVEVLEKQMAQVQKKEQEHSEESEGKRDTTSIKKTCRAFAGLQFGVILAKE